MLVLANEMFNSPPVFAWVLPVFVCLQPRQGGNFFSSVTVAYFCFFFTWTSSKRYQKKMKGVGGKGQGKPGRGKPEGKGKGKGKVKGKGRGAGVGSTYANKYSGSSRPT